SSRVVRGRVTDSAGAFADFTTTITVNNVAPTPSVSGPASGTSGTALSFTGSATDPSTADAAGLSYSWNFGHGATASGQNVSHAYGVAGTFTVALTVTDKDGGQGTATKAVQVTAPVTAITATFSNGGAVSEGSTGTVSFANVSGGSGSGYT